MTLIFHEFADLTLAKIKICKNGPPNTKFQISKTSHPPTNAARIHIQRNS